MTPPNTLSPQPLSDACDEHRTEPLDARLDDPVDALPLLEHRLRRLGVPVALATPGRYLAIDAGDETLLLRLERDITHIGRGLAADLRLDDDRVSRRHAIIVRRGADTHLLDDRSSNGTFVNGRRILDARLGDGDLIRVGPVALRYVELPDAVSTPEPASAGLRAARRPPLELVAHPRQIQPVRRRRRSRLGARPAAQ
jgi:hypothetical protein